MARLSAILSIKDTANLASISDEVRGFSAAKTGKRAGTGSNRSFAATNRNFRI